MSAPNGRNEREVALVSRLFYPEYGGPGISLWRLAPRLERAGYRVLVLTRIIPDAPRCERVANLEIHRGGEGRSLVGEASFILTVLTRLFRNRRRYNAIHVFHSGWVSFLVPLLGRALGKRTCFTMTLLDSDDPRAIAGMRFAALKLRLFRAYDRVIYINPEMAHRYQEVYGTRDRLISGSLGIDVDAFQSATTEQRRDARSRLGLGQDVHVAAFTGAVTIRKGIDRAVDIWLKVTESLPQAGLLVIGPTTGPHCDVHPELMRRIEAAGKTDNIRFLGETRSSDEVLRLLHAADVFLFPSRKEGTPSAVLEAMACGVIPILAPLEGFTGEVVRDGVEGLVLDPGTGVEACARRIVGLLESAGQRERMKTAARERVLATHSQEFAVDTLIQAWEEPRVTA